MLSESHHLCGGGKPSANRLPRVGSVHQEISKLPLYSVDTLDHSRGVRTVVDRHIQAQNPRLFQLLGVALRSDRYIVELDRAIIVADADSWFSAGLVRSRGKEHRVVDGASQGSLKLP